MVYIRQSSADQVRDNRKSGERQYSLVERAAALGCLGDDDRRKPGAFGDYRRSPSGVQEALGGGQRRAG
jgi:hypothetical protein